MGEVFKGFIFLVHFSAGTYNSVSVFVCEGPSLFAGLDHWTGLLDWTTGLTFELILGVLHNSLIIHYCGVERFSRICSKYKCYQL